MQEVNLEIHRSTSTNEHRRSAVGKLGSRIQAWDDVQGRSILDCSNSLKQQCSDKHLQLQLRSLRMQDPLLWKNLCLDPRRSTVE